MNETNKLYNGDALEVLKTLPDNCIDLIATDPPYQLSSMTHKRTDKIAVEGTDGTGNPFCRPQAAKGFMDLKWDILPTVETLKECLRVMKHGAFAFWMMTPRQDNLCEFISRLQQAGFVTSFTSLYWVYTSGFPKAANTAKLIDKRLGCERERGKHPAPPSIEKMNVYGDYSDEAISDEAKRMQGSYAGFQPKPALEVVVISMKPLSEKSYTEQALDNGKGVTWLDSVRIPYKNAQDAQDGRAAYIHPQNTIFNPHPENRELAINKDGRFPANVLVSDDALDDGNIHKGRRTLMGMGMENVKRGNVYGKYGDLQSVRGYDDEGGASRYFSLDTWWQERIKKLPKEVRDTFPCLIVPKPATSEKNVAGNMTISNEDKYDSKMPSSKADKQAVNHPTVKSIALMSYLITLGSREHDTVLDPFVGSGTTCIAAYLLSRKFIGIERDQQYFALAQERVGHYTTQKKLFDTFDEPKENILI